MLSSNVSSETKESYSTAVSMNLDSKSIKYSKLQIDNYHSILSMGLDKDLIPKSLACDKLKKIQKTFEKEFLMLNSYNCKTMFFVDQLYNDDTSPIPSMPTTVKLTWVTATNSKSREFTDKKIYVSYDSLIRLMQSVPTHFFDVAKNIILSSEKKYQVRYVGKCRHGENCMKKKEYGYYFSWDSETGVQKVGNFVKHPNSCSYYLESPKEYYDQSSHCVRCGHAENDEFLEILESLCQGLGGRPLNKFLETD